MEKKSDTRTTFTNNSNIKYRNGNYTTKLSIKFIIDGQLDHKVIQESISNPLTQQLNFDFNFSRPITSSCSAGTTPSYGNDLYFPGATTSPAIADNPHMHQGLLGKVESSTLGSVYSRHHYDWPFNAVSAATHKTEGVNTGDLSMNIFSNKNKYCGQ